jgi:sigma-E factor negative regulatory protein RseC
MKESKSPGSISHQGIVKEKTGKSVFVSIISVSACSECHKENLCSISGNKEKIVEITGDYDVMPGDAVTVLMKQSMGHAAVVLGYFLPFILVIATLVILFSFKISELFAGLISLAILAPYYYILFLFRRKINKKFTFTLKT